MDAHEFMEWVAYETVEGPVGRHRTNALLATLCLIVGNMFAGKGRKFKYEDFVPEYRKPKPTPEQLAKKMEAFVAMHNARFEKK